MEFNFSPFELLYYVNTLQQKHPDLGGSKEVYKWWNLHGRTNSSQPEKRADLGRIRCPPEPMERGPFVSLLAFFAVAVAPSKTRLILPAGESY